MSDRTSPESVPTSAQPAPRHGLVLVSWDGSSPVLSHIHQDVAPQFDLLLFDYSGRCTETKMQIGEQACTVLSQRTECKGDIYQALAAHLHHQPQLQHEFISLIDDDVILRIGQINELLHIGHLMRLDAFSACLTHDSLYSHRWTLQRGNRLLHWVDWVEVMMPFYRREVFMAAAPYFEGWVSSHGFDRYLFPTVQKLSGRERTALVNTVAASHVRPVSSGDKTFRNGQTALQERHEIRRRCVEMIRHQAPELQQTPWFKRIFEQRHVRTRWQMLIYGLGRPIRRWLEMST
jgi:hypothetical protein